MSLLSLSLRRLHILRRPASNADTAGTVTVDVAKLGEPAYEDIKHLKIKKPEECHNLGSTPFRMSTSLETDRASLEATLEGFTSTGKCQDSR